MGTPSLIAGIGFMIAGFIAVIQGLTNPYFSAESYFGLLLVNLILGIPLIVIGGLLLRKYDKDKKKEKTQTS